MKRTFLLIGSTLLLASCASPTFQMPPEQVASLSDDQLCRYKNNYRDEVKLNAEISKRRLNCDRFFRECLSQGNQPGTQAMNFCIAVLRENERLSYDYGRHYHGYGHGHVGLHHHYPIRRHR